MKLLTAIIAAVCLLGFGSAAAAPDAPASKQVFREIPWDDLVPKDWDPMKSLRDPKVGALSDGSPQMQELMREMREVWDKAPTVRALNGAAVKLPGYVVPLESAKGEIMEFLLVPYFGACIHSPPPPANQIVHVVLDKPVKGLRSMDAVWVSGTLKTERQDSQMGASGYRMSAVSVVMYDTPKARQ